ncbi:MAG: AAA family ATPase [Lachnospiraceae bacterium]|nr:AAA family ATPase [Lachnospiraceae bacterium]
MSDEHKPDRRQHAREEDEIDIGSLMFRVWKKRREIAICTVLGFLVGLVFYAVSLLYGGSVLMTSIAVVSQNADGKFTGSGGDKTSPNYNDLQMSQDMAESVAYIATSNQVLNQVRKKINLIGVDNRTIKSALTAERYGETQIIELILHWDNTSEGQEILTALNEILPSVLEDTLKVGNVSVVNEPAVSSQNAIFGRKEVLMAGLVGFLASVIYFVIRALSHPTILDGESLRGKTGLELLGEVPQGRIQEYMYNQLLLNEKDEFPYQFRESMAYIAHLVAHRLSERQGHKIFFVTSSFSGEGKSTVAANLAIELSRFNPKVLLVDVNFHAPALGRLFFDKTQHEHSINAMHTNEESGDEAVLSLTSYFDLLPARVEEMPVKLVGNLSVQLEKLFQEYDYVVLDASSVGAISDVLPVLELTREAVYVVEQDRASRDVIRADVKDLERLGVHILGAIVTKVNTRWQGFRRQYGYDTEPRTSVELPAEERAALRKSILQKKALFRKNAELRDEREAARQQEEDRS